MFNSVLLLVFLFCLCTPSIHGNICYFEFSISSRWRAKWLFFPGKTIQSKRCKFVSLFFVVVVWFVLSSMNASWIIQTHQSWNLSTMTKVVGRRRFKSWQYREHKSKSRKKREREREKGVQFRESERESNTPVKKTLIAWFTMNAIAGSQRADE